LTDGHRAEAHINKVVRASEQAAALTQQMLAYSGHGHFSIRPLNLNDLLKNHANLWRAALSHRVTLQLDLTPELPMIDADASQIQQMVLNLLLNAAQASGQAGIITISTAPRQIRGTERRYWQFTGQPLEAGDYLSLKVSDGGGGIPAGYLSHIFDPFFTTKEEGRGLGLAAVLGIVRGHNAGLAVYNRDGSANGGATFEILFPVSRRVSGASRNGGAAASGRRDGQGYVLVIDDEEMVLEAVADILVLEDISVLKANSGPEGLDMYRQHADKIELVLLDLSMPGMSGAETYQQLRQLDPNLRVLLSSGYDASNIGVHFDEDGPSGFLQKPYTVSALLDAVGRHLPD
jgi:CheY-like chemotaxis protein